MKITGKWQVIKMSNIWTIMKKEFDRFFKDKRMVISTLLLPGLMIYLVYTIMGTAMGSQFMTDEEYVYKIEVENMPSSIETFFGEEMFEVTKTETLDMETLAQRISDGDVDVAIVFDDNFDAAVKGGGAESSDIAVYYNSTVTSSSEAYSVVTNILDTLEQSIVDIFRINGDAEVQYDLSTKEEMAGFLLAMIMPMLLISFLFSGSMAVAPEAIAGEKERGTMATLLVTPVNRAHIAIGKVLSLSAISLLSGLSSFLGIILALPSYMESMMENVDNAGIRSKGIRGSLNRYFINGTFDCIRVIRDFCLCKIRKRSRQFNFTLYDCNHAFGHNNHFWRRRDTAGVGLFHSYV